HVGWHEVVRRELARRRPSPSEKAGAQALFLAEAIASAFHLYLVGRLLARAPECDFVTTQLPLMAECAAEAGLPQAGFSALLDEGVPEPGRALEDPRARHIVAA